MLKYLSEVIKPRLQGFYWDRIEDKFGGWFNLFYSAQTDANC